MYIYSFSVIFESNYLGLQRVSLLNTSEWIIYCFIFPAEVYIGLDKETEATACIKEANLLFPHSPDVLFQVGMHASFTLMRLQVLFMWPS